MKWKTTLFAQAGDLTLSATTKPGPGRTLTIKVGNKTTVTMRTWVLWGDKKFTYTVKNLPYAMIGSPIIITDEKTEEILFWGFIPECEK